MKILIPLVGTFGKEGGWRVLSQLANYWIKAGHKVVFLSHIKSEGPYYPTNAEILYYNNRGELFPYPNRQEPKARMGPFQLRRTVEKILNSATADIVLATHSFTAKPVQKSLISAEKFYYIQAYEPDYYYQQNIKNYFYKKISENSYKLGLNLIVNAPMYLNYHEIKTDMFVFPGLDLDVFRPNPPIKSSDKIILGTVGRLEKYKGTSFVIEAFREIRKKLKDRVELHIAFGDDSLSTEDGVVIVRPDGDLNLAHYYNSLTIYICAGLIQLEAVHYPVIEAMACGIPVITTGYLPSTEENSWKIPIKNPKEIEAKVFMILNDELGRKKKTSKALEDVNCFDWKTVSNKMLTYFQKKHF